MDTNRALDVAMAAARRGGEVARMRLGDPGYVTWKGHRDVVCEASFYVQNAIASTIQAEYPDAGILGEEVPDDAPLPVDDPELGIIDPICGSLNFVQGIPYFGVSLALRAEGNICVGVVYDPCRDELFAATLDGAAGLILQRAGGGFTDEHGNAWLYSDGGYIATNAVIHGWTLNCIQAGLKV